VPHDAAVHRHEERTSTVADSPPGGSLTQTFVVRLWETPAPSWGTAEGLRGVVEHIQSGDSVAFGDEVALLTFLQTAGSAGGSSTGGTS
jgi:hypothetical protein